MKLVFSSIFNALAVATITFIIINSCSSFKEVLNSSILKVILACFTFVSLLLYKLEDKLRDILEKLERLERKS